MIVILPTLATSYFVASHLSPPHTQTLVKLIQSKPKGFQSVVNFCMEHEELEGDLPDYIDAKDYISARVSMGSATEKEMLSKLKDLLDERHINVRRYVEISVELGECLHGYFLLLLACLSACLPVCSCFFLIICLFV